MSEEKQFDKQLDNDPERTLITLEQLSQTIEVMTSVVNRLRHHLSEQLKSQLKAQEHAILEDNSAQTETEDIKKDQPPEAKQLKNNTQQDSNRESFVVEIRQQANKPVRKTTKILH